MYVFVNFSILSVYLRILAVAAVSSSFDCYLANCGLQTLHVHVRPHIKKTLAIDKSLEGYLLVENAIYSGKRSEGGIEGGGGN